MLASKLFYFTQNLICPSAYDLLYFLDGQGCPHICVLIYLKSQPKSTVSFTDKYANLLGTKQIIFK